MEFDVGPEFDVHVDERLGIDGKRLERHILVER